MIIWSLTGDCIHAIIFASLLGHLRGSLAYKFQFPQVKCVKSACWVQKVLDHKIIGPKKCFEFSENISPRKTKIVLINIDKRRNSEEKF